MMKKHWSRKKKMSDINCNRFKKALIYLKDNSDNNMYLVLDSLIETNNIITGSNNITLTKINTKPK